MSLGPHGAAPATAVREPGIRRTVWRRSRDFLEYGRGALWLLPSVAGVVALVIGWVLSSIDVGDTGPFGWVVFEGTPDDARTYRFFATGGFAATTALRTGTIAPFAGSAAAFARVSTSF